MKNNYNKQRHFLTNMEIVIEFESEYNTVPTRGTPGSVGDDFTYKRDDDIVIQPQKCELIPLDIKIKLPENTGMMFMTRSSFAKQQIYVLGGVIDNDYRGTVGCLLQNSSDKPFTVTKDMKVCQGVTHFIPKTVYKRVDKLENDTLRGEGSFGSTGSHNKN